MRYAENGDLLDFILKKGAVSEGQARVWFRQIALALQYLHEMEIAHRDLKCENALITVNYNLKVADFGFARYVVDSRGERLTSDTYCGSLSYAAPEILRGIPYHAKIADIWSMGVILYIMLNKAMPFDDSNIKRLYEQQTNKRWKFRAKVIDVLSDQVKKLTTCLLEPDVSKRWRVEQILNSDWIAMDARLVDMSPAERVALLHAQELKRKYKNDGIRPKTLAKIKRKDDSIEDISIVEDEKIDRKLSSCGLTDKHILKEEGNKAEVDKSDAGAQK